MIALLENLKIDIPFSYLDKGSFGEIETSAHIAYYPKSTVLIQRHTALESLYYIIKGRVVCQKDEEMIDVYQNHDTFGGIELIENKTSDYDYRVEEELICYEIPAKVFLTLTQENQAFRAYFFSTMVERMALLKDKKEFSAIGDLMVSRVDTSILHEVFMVQAKTPILEALDQMDRANATCILVENAQGYGIITDKDLRHYILNKETKNLRVAADIQTYPLSTIHEGELLFNILLLMTGQSIKHLPVLDEQGKAIGILELIDLLSYFSNQTHLVSVQVEKAQTLDAVIAAVKRVNVIIEALHTKGIKTRYIAKLVSEINRKMYRKIFTFIMPKEWHEKSNFIVLGSEGRGEQLLRTDQDNALIFEDSFEPKMLEEITHRFIAVLDEIGFPRCAGNVMIINPKWAKSLRAYKNDIDTWVDAPTYEGFMDMAILFDSMSVAGEVSLHQRLIAYMIQKVQETKTILPHFMRAIEHFDSPLGLFSQFISTDKEHKNQIDIKKGALFALVHGVRGLALEHRITLTNTTLRIKELNTIGYLSKEDAKNLIEALEVINTLRLDAQLIKQSKGEPMDNYISLNTLSKIERDALKEVLKTVNAFKKRLGHHFHLSVVG
ncbi:MAG TPA: putative nucleotidyltransferase substrate binding domain-containing protein [Sulfurovum sp.]|jgi:CBS domain-containing protein|nr:MAG: hypothetical protein B7Y63_01305 [Sulfurovum sp. 35-42-20]OYZ26029.1 MAG: hypothetical protein B7Y23_03230 [Sulfurovum sp. 16-42-52]OYZ50419.1 MAG: hypothetical protein B7Y13_00920 [Sulfurovum sp. 24-42-9]OZA46035.1 MAG: hypothetical protein B7X80_03655 [Sulfurovum sp. 17-42-90]OZA60306.1 MAG: hypothetical protein B7X69_04300 [Sulfurovum sp. 39-42-12]HQR73378.1 putative nucleotidyltransferase substrate binding domain-containing protein [Sulfurovum sp.]